MTTVDSMITQKIQEFVYLIKSGAGWSSDDYLHSIIDLEPSEIKLLAIELSKEGLLFKEDQLPEESIYEGKMPVGVKPISLQEIEILF